MLTQGVSWKKDDNCTNYNDVVLTLRFFCSVLPPSVAVFMFSLLLLPPAIAITIRRQWRAFTNWYNIRHRVTIKENVVQSWNCINAGVTSLLRKNVCIK